MGVHVYLYSDDVSKVHCPQGVGSAPREKSALCHAISDADGKFAFHSLPCGNYLSSFLNLSVSHVFLVCKMYKLS